MVASDDAPKRAPEPDPGQDETVALLSRPETYGLPGARVERVETHISIVFLVGPDAYKLKRAVKYPYLDFSTAERRRRYCEAEVEVNRRTAPEIYRGVKPVTREPDGRLALDGRGSAVDWVVAMRRFDQTRLLDRMAEDGELPIGLMTTLGVEIARFHARAARRTEVDGARSLAWMHELNSSEIRRHTPAVFPPDMAAGYFADAGRALEAAGALLVRRGADGMIRDCHGDLHLRNVCLIDGRPVLFDAIEFDDRLSRIDVLYDLAFLIMDLEHRALRGHANAVLTAYLDETVDLEGLAALPLFLALRAGIRAHTTATQAEMTGDAGAAAERRAEARAYLALGRAFLQDAPARLIAVGGVSGTGKSTLARGVAPDLGRAPGAIVLRTDAIRKRLFGVAETVRLGPEGYTEDAHRRVYDELFARAGRVLAAGHSAVLDATFLHPESRARAPRVAREAGAAFAGLWLEAAPEVLAGRVAERIGDASDADLAVLESQLRDAAAPAGWARVSAEGEPGRVLAAARRALGPGPA